MRLRSSGSLCVVLVFAILVSAFIAGCGGGSGNSGGGGGTTPTTLSITTPSALPAGTVSKAYSTTIVATGGTAPYTWTVATGSTLPAGLALSTAGVLSGTPTAAGSSSFTIQVADAEATPQTAILKATLAINPPPPVITTTLPLPSGTLNVAYSLTLAATSGTAPYTWSVPPGTLPAGLTLNASTGVISGTPTVAGSSAITITVTDSETTQQMGTLAGTIVINPSLAITTPSPLPAGTLGAGYNTVLAASGGTTPYTWSLTSTSTLPAGLTLNRATGVIAGIPTAAGSFPFTIEATDSSATPQVATAVYTVAITAGTLSVTTTTKLTSGTVGAKYSTTLAAAGGMPPYAWSLATGSTLPAGLTLSGGTGVISGTPTTAAPYSAPDAFTIQVTDAEATPMTATLNATMAINSSLTITTASPLTAGTVNVAYSLALAASGGTGPYVWSVAAGTLPAGLTLSPAGSLAGTPTAPGTSSFTVAVTDAEATAQTATLSATLVVNPATLAISNAGVLPQGTVASAYSDTLTATGGVAPYSWSVKTGVLPAGLTISSAGVIAGTPTAVQNLTFSVVVSDAESTPQTATLTATLVVNPTPGTIPDGFYSFLFSGTSPQGSPAAPSGVALDGTFTIKTGVILSGFYDENTNTGPPVLEQAITGGTLANGTDGIGTLSLTTASGTISFALATPASVATAGSDSAIRMIEFDDTTGAGTRGSGVLKAAAGNATLAGITGTNFAFLFSGSDSNQAQEALVCGFVTNGAGTITTGTADANQQVGGTPTFAHWPTTGVGANPVTGTYTVDANGRGLLNFNLGGFNGTGGTTFHYSFYQVSPSEWLAISIDPVTLNAPLASGTVLQQTVPAGGFTLASLPTTSVVELSGIASVGGSQVADLSLGLATSDGAGNVTFSYDEYAGTLNAGQTMTVSYTTANATTGQLVTATDGSDPMPILYAINSSSAFALFPNSSAASGVLQAQTAGPFISASFSGNYLGGSLPLSVTSALNEDGLVNADGDGNLTFTSSRSTSTGLVLYQNVVGTYSVDATTGKVTVTTADGLTRTFYVVSPTEVVYLTSDGGGYIGSFQQ